MHKLSCYLTLNKVNSAVQSLRPLSTFLQNADRHPECGKCEVPVVASQPYLWGDELINCRKLK